MSISNMTLGFILAVVLVLLALIVVGISPVVDVLARIGAVTVFFWAGLELVRRRAA